MTTGSRSDSNQRGEFAADRALTASQVLTGSFRTRPAHRGSYFVGKSAPGVFAGERASRLGALRLWIFVVASRDLND